jgi:hypothetical protein
METYRGCSSKKQPLAPGVEIKDSGLLDEGEGSTVRSLPKINQFFELGLGFRALTGKR